MTEHDNTEEDQLNETKPVSVRAITPGELLREQRELRGLSLQQVADELHLTMHFVRALEADAYDKLPGDVFTRGYLRSYANLVGLDVEQIMTNFNVYVGEKEKLQQGTRKLRASKLRKDKNLPWIIVSGVAFVVVAIALWYFNNAAG